VQLRKLVSHVNKINPLCKALMDRIEQNTFKPLHNKATSAAGCWLLAAGCWLLAAGRSTYLCIIRKPHRASLQGDDLANTRLDWPNTSPLHVAKPSSLFNTWHNLLRWPHSAAQLLSLTSIQPLLAGWLPDCWSICHTLAPKLKN
jgi:hypothetical protein